MFDLTDRAAEQVRKSLREGDEAGLALRVAATRKEDGSIEYKMGFDDIGKADTHLSCGGVDVVIAKRDKELLNGAALDYVELEPGQFHFIFLNPNDPNYRPPTE